MAARAHLRGAVVTIAALTTLAATALAQPRPVHAQVLTGRVLDERSDFPVAGAEVVLVAEGGRPVVRLDADSLGRFRIRIPSPGAYTLAASRLGYEAGETPLLDLSFDGTRALDLTLRPLPIGLPGLEVTVSAEERLHRAMRAYGVLPTQLPASRIVTTEEIEAVAGALDFGHVLQRQNIAGVTVVREQDRRIGAPPRVCVKMGEGWSSGCTLLVVDGVVTPQNSRIQRAAVIPTESIEAMVVLKPSEASLVFGTIGGNGAVLIFTRASGSLR